MALTIRAVATEDDVAREGALFVVEQARAAIADHGRFTFAVSGGRTPWAMFAHLDDAGMPWDDVAIYQVDERVAPDGDPDRNLTHLRESLPDRDVEVHAMPVNDADLDAAAAAYAQTLPDRFDLVHLGLGPDGHTASLVPSDPVLDVTDRKVGLTQPYQGHPRMTLTYPVLDRAAQIMWLVTGAEKAGPLERLRAGDQSIPAGRVTAGNQVAIADASAAGQQ